MPLARTHCVVGRVMGRFMAAAVLIASSSAASAQCTRTKLIASNGTELDEYGAAVAVDDAFMLIGAPGRHQASNEDAGAVYGLARINGTWTQQQFIQPNTTAGDRFGNAVAMGYPFAVIGEVRDGDNVGGVHMYQHVAGTWTSLGKFVPPGSDADDYVGQSVAMNDQGDICVVGAPQRSNASPFIGLVGKAWVYTRNAANVWSIELTLEKPAAQRELNDRYGAGVATWNNNVAIGIPGDDTVDGVHSPGSVRISRRISAGTWLDEGTVRPPAADLSTAEWFGESVSLFGNTLAVGAPMTDVNGVTDVGAVYIFKSTPGGWILEDKVVASDAAFGFKFGMAVSVHGQRLVVGDGRTTGRAYIFHQQDSGAWVQESVQASDANGTFFPGGLDIDGSVVVVGDHTENYGGATYRGDAYVIPIDADAGSDLCGGAEHMNLGQVMTGCTQVCGNEGEPGCFGFTTGPDAWYELTPGCTASYTIDLYQTDGSFDTVLSVHPACGQPAIACDDDSGTGRNSRITTLLRGGQTYFVRVSGYGGDAGAFGLYYYGNSPVNDDCASALPLIDSETATGSTCFGDSDLANNPCGGVASNPGDDVWYTYVAECSGQVAINTNGSFFDTILSVHTGCPGEFLALTVACDDDGGIGTNSALQFSATEGHTYRVRIGGYNGASGAYSVTLTNDCPEPPVCGCDWTGEGDLDSQDYFEFLEDFFAGDADYNGLDGTDSQDYFEFLECFFAGCP